MSDITHILEAIERGDIRAKDELFPRVYEELRRLAGARMVREQPGQTLQPTALIHEAWLRLGGESQPHWENRAHFFGAAAEAMRRILVDRARRRQVRAASGLSDPAELHESQIPLPVPEAELLSLDEALEGLAKVDAGAAELVKLRYFAGLKMSEAAAAQGLSLRQTERLWTFARAWLRDTLNRAREHGNP